MGGYLQKIIERTRIEQLINFITDGAESEVNEFSTSYDTFKFELIELMGESDFAKIDPIMADYSIGMSNIYTEIGNIVGVKMVYDLFLYEKYDFMSFLSKVYLNLPEPCKDIESLEREIYKLEDQLDFQLIFMLTEEKCKEFQIRRKVNDYTSALIDSELLKSIRKSARHALLSN